MSVIVLSTQIGGGDATQTTGRYTSPEYDPELPGFAGNYSRIDTGSELHPRRFMVDTPAVEAEARDPVSAEQPAEYLVEIPHDDFSVEA